jgi:hypothetical protein
MLFFCTFAHKDKESITSMTQKEAIIKALDALGGRAKLVDIYPRVIQLAKFKPDSDKQATIRTTLQRHPECFRSSTGKPKGWWELVSYQKELAELKNKVAELTETNKLIIAIPKEAEFIDKFLKEVMNVYKYERKKADPIRIIMRTLGHEEAAEVLDAWIDEKEDELKKALDKLSKLTIAPINVQGDYVIDKHVGNEVNGVASGGTGINVSKEEE